jgi:mRNA interferase MazF
MVRQTSQAIGQGDVYWFDFGPPVGSAPAELHPCVVVQSDKFNRSNIRTTVVCVITSNVRLAEAPGNVALKKGEANLPKPSVINVSQVMTVDKHDLENRMGRISQASLDLTLAGLQFIFERERVHPITAHSKQ